MKYAIYGLRGQINRIAPTEPTNLLEGQSVKHITDAQADLVEAGKLSTPRLFYFVINNEFKTQAETFAIRQVEREQAYLASSPEQERNFVLAKKAAWDASASMFQSLSPGKQALWEPVRIEVAKAIKAGDFAKAKVLIETVPSIYDGMENDRNMFLQLFA